MFAIGSPNPLLLMPQDRNYCPPKNKLDLYNELQLILGYEKFKKVLSAIELLEKESLLRNPFAELTAVFQKREEQNLVSSSTPQICLPTPEKVIEKPTSKASTAAKSQRTVSNPTTSQTLTSQHTTGRAKAELANILHKYPKYFRSQSLKSVYTRQRFAKQKLQLTTNEQSSVANTWARKSLEVRLGIKKEHLQAEEKVGLIKLVRSAIERFKAKLKEIKCRIEVFKYNHMLRT